MVKGKIDLNIYNGNSLVMLEKNSNGTIVEHSKIEFKHNEPVIVLYQIENDEYINDKAYVVMSELSGESLTIDIGLVNINNEDELKNVPILKL